MANRIWIAKTLAVTLLAVLFSGCTGDEKAPGTPQGAPDATDPYRDASGQRDLRTDLTAEDTLAAPAWSVGYQFGHHVFFGVQDTTGEHINTIVVEEEGANWFMATDSREFAIVEAAYDIPILGPIAKDDLSTTFFGSEWDLYDFPLSQGKTWSGSALWFDEDFDAEPVDVTLTATYNAKIDTPDGDRPGFDIEGVTAEGDRMLKFDFVPDIGWYAHFYLYNVETEDEDDFVFHVMSMGHGPNWTGTYYVDESDFMIGHESVVGIMPGVPPTAILEPEPTGTFTMPAGSTYLYGFLGAFAYGGVHKTVLVDPAAEVHDDWTAQGTDPDEAAFVFTEVYLPAVEGEWRLVSVGAGVVSGSFGELWAITETSGTL